MLYFLFIKILNGFINGIILYLKIIKYINYLYLKLISNTIYIMEIYNLKDYIKKFNNLQEKEDQQKRKLKIKLDKEHKEEKKRNSPDYEILKEIKEDEKREREEENKKEIEENLKLIGKVCIHNKKLMKIVKVSRTYVYYIEYVKQYEMKFNDDVLYYSFGNYLYLSEYLNEYIEYDPKKPQKILLSQFYNMKIINEPDKIEEIIFINDKPIIKKGSIFENDNYKFHQQREDFFKIRFNLRSISTGHLNLETNPPRYVKEKQTLLNAVKFKIKNLEEDQIYRILYDLKTFDIYINGLRNNPYNGYDYVEIYKTYIKDK
jgi:hypothetical protein